MLNRGIAAVLEVRQIRTDSMNIRILVAFLLGMIVLSATPGPGVFASMSKAIAEGFRASLFFIGGLVLGDITFLLLAFFGLSTLAKTMSGMFLIARILGGLYVIYLGIRACGSVQHRSKVESQRDRNRFQTFTGGLLVTWSNPKPILFYASVLPTIIDFREVHAIDIIIMVILIALVSFSVLGTYCYIASMTNKLGLSRKWEKRINQAAGIVMIMVGIFIIVR